MPIYEYQCNRCGKVTEVYGQTVESAGPPVVCTCGQSQSFTKLYSSFAAHGSSEFQSVGECGNGPGECESPGSGGCCGGMCGHGH